MRRVQECWHGKEGAQPSIKAIKVQRWRDTHTHTHARTPVCRSSSFSVALHRRVSVALVQARDFKEPSQQVSIATPFSGIDAAQLLGNSVGRQMV